MVIVRYGPLGLYRTFRITGQGVCFCGEGKDVSICTRRETKLPAIYERRGVKMPEVTGVRPETGRSNPEQGEARVTPRGGPKRCCVHAFV